MRLNEKVVLISGTASGQGRAAAQIFAREGASVVGCDIDVDGAKQTAALLREDGLDMTSLAPLDVTKREDISRWISAAVRQYGGIDVLYNNASLARFAPFAEMSVEDYEFDVQHELHPVWHACQLAWPHLIARGGGAIINLASIAGLIGSRDLHQAAHSASKGAVIGLTRQLAADGAAAGIRANCISPGVIASPPVLEILAMGDKAPVNSMIRATANGKPGEPEDIAYAALYLASDEAKWVNGANLVVDGGTSVLV